MEGEGGGGRRREEGGGEEKRVDGRRYGKSNSCLEVECNSLNQFCLLYSPVTIFPPHLPSSSPFPTFPPHLSPPHLPSSPPLLISLPHLPFSPPLLISLPHLPSLLLTQVCLPVFAKAPHTKELLSLSDPRPSYSLHSHQPCPPCRLP